MKVIKYKSYSNIWVKFEQGKPIHTSWQAFLKGNVRNPYDKSVFGVGYLGEGIYKTKINRKATQQYRIWKGILERGYDKKHNEKFPSYKNVTVCEEWHNFQNFAKWFDENYYEIEDEKMTLDKDILIKGNKIYSPENCVFVPSRINVLFTKRNKSRGEFPIGVTYHKTKKQFESQCSNLIKGIKKIIHIGYYDNPEDAFQAYKKYKEKVIKEIADEYKDKIPYKLYKAMYTYQVEITD